MVGRYLGKAASARSLRIEWCFYPDGATCACARAYPRVATNGESASSSTRLQTNGIKYHTPLYHTIIFNISGSTFVSRFTFALELKSPLTIDFGPALEILINLKSKSCEQRSKPRT